MSATAEPPATPAAEQERRPSSIEDLATSTMDKVVKVSLLVGVHASFETCRRTPTPECWPLTQPQDAAEVQAILQRTHGEQEVHEFEHQARQPHAQTVVEQQGV